MKGIIYLLTNMITGDMYVGQTTKKLANRWHSHYTRLNCRKLGAAIAKYGKDQFYVDQIDTGASYTELNWKEQYWIEILQTLTPNGYNLTKGGFNRTPSDETRQIIGNNSRGRVTTEETKQKISEASKRRAPDTDETRKKRSLAQTGKKASEETRRKLSESHKGQRRFGRKASAETKLKMSAIHKGNKYNLGKQNSLGHRHSEEVKRKMCETKRIWWAEKRANAQIPQYVQLALQF